MNNSFPAVSVIIPLYNAEKYIAECLESILAQTFRNFEVIVVDDCSTDNSVAIVKSYAEKFGGRLFLSSTGKNSGSGALPRNKGMNFSRGEYIAFVDADDLITSTALEEMYTLAKEYDADVVYFEKYFMSEGFGSEFMSNIHPAVERIQSPPFVSEPTFETDDLSQRVKHILDGRFWVTPWQKFVRRNLIFEHEIFFPHCKISEDDIWTYGLIFYAKKFLRIPNLTYIRRMTNESMVNSNRTPQQAINFWLNPLIYGLKTLDDLMSRHEFFEQNLQYRYAVLEMFVFGKLNCCLQASLQLPPFKVYETIKQNFGDNLGDNEVLICALCAALNNLQRSSVRMISALTAQSQQRITELERINRENKAYISELEKFITELNRKD